MPPPHRVTAGRPVLTIQNMDSIKKFVAESLGSKISPRVSLLASRLQIPYVQEILREHAVQGMQP